MSSKCVHSCRGLCNALSIAEKHEADALREYRQFIEDCDYPEVREFLDELVAEKQKILTLVKEKRSTIQAKMGTIDDIMGSF